MHESRFSYMKVALAITAVLFLVLNLVPFSSGDSPSKEIAGTRYATRADGPIVNKTPGDPGLIFTVYEGFDDLEDDFLDLAGQEGPGLEDVFYDPNWEWNETAFEWLPPAGSGYSRQSSPLQLEIVTYPGDDVFGEVALRQEDDDFNTEIYGEEYYKLRIRAYNESGSSETEVWVKVINVNDPPTVISGKDFFYVAFNEDSSYVGINEDHDQLIDIFGDPSDPYDEITYKMEPIDPEHEITSQIQINMTSNGSYIKFSAPPNWACPYLPPGQRNKGDNLNGWKNYFAGFHANVSDQDGAYHRDKFFVYVAPKNDPPEMERPVSEKLFTVSDSEEFSQMQSTYLQNGIGVAQGLSDIFADHGFTLNTGSQIKIGGSGGDYEIEDNGVIFYLDKTRRNIGGNPTDVYDISASFVVQEDHECVIQLEGSDLDLQYDQELRYDTNITDSIYDSTGIQIEFEEGYSWDEDEGLLRFNTDNNFVGDYHIAAWVNDRNTEGYRADYVNTPYPAYANFTLRVENVNDPLEAFLDSPDENFPYNTSSVIEFNASRSSDPDMRHGQILNYTWTSNGEFLGYGPFFTRVFPEVGTYNIKVNVTDGEFFEVVQTNISVVKRVIPGEIFDGVDMSRDYQDNVSESVVFHKSNEGYWIEKGGSDSVDIKSVEGFREPSNQRIFNIRVMFEDEVDFVWTDQKTQTPTLTIYFIKPGYEEFTVSPTPDQLSVDYEEYWPKPSADMIYASMEFDLRQTSIISYPLFPISTPSIDMLDTKKGAEISLTIMDMDEMGVDVDFELLAVVELETVITDSEGNNKVIRSWDSAGSGTGVPVLEDVRESSDDEKDEEGFSFLWIILALIVIIIIIVVVVLVIVLSKKKKEPEPSPQPMEVPAEPSLDEMVFGAPSENQPTAEQLYGSTNEQAPESLPPSQEQQQAAGLPPAQTEQGQAQSPEQPQQQPSQQVPPDGQGQQPQEALRQEQPQDAGVQPQQQVQGQYQQPQPQQPQQQAPPQ